MCILRISSFLLLIFTAFSSFCQSYSSYSFHEEARKNLRVGSYAHSSLSLTSTPSDSISPINYFFHRGKRWQYGFQPQLLMLGGVELDGGDINFAHDVTIGGQLFFQFKKRLSISGGILQTNMNPFGFEEAYIKEEGIISGLGKTDTLASTFNNTQFLGSISFAASKHFQFELGNRKLHWGDGYRSLILSDATDYFPHFKITTSIWKVKYVNLFAKMRDIRPGFEDPKYGAFHYLSWQIHDKFNLSLFESVIWMGKDTLNERGFDVNYLNPIIFYRPVEYAIGSADNSLMGINLKWDLFPSFSLYGQGLIDEFLLKEIRNNQKWWGNKYAFQAGGKWIKPFNIKGLMLQGEANFVRPFTYSHGNSLQNYAHENQSLAHPLGANFKELVGIVFFSKGKWEFENKTIVARFGENTNNINYGGDVYTPYTLRQGDYNHMTGQGNLNTLIINSFTAKYFWDRQKNIAQELGIILRDRDNELSSSSNVSICLALRWNFAERYRDFF